MLELQTTYINNYNFTLLQQKFQTAMSLLCFTFTAGYTL